MSEREKIAATIDHALLHPTLGRKELEAGLAEIAHLPLASVCVKPYQVERAAELLESTEIGIGTVVSFPHGSATTATKVSEAVQLAELGAAELDMVVNVGRVLGGEWAEVERELRAVKTALAETGVLLKLIFETDFVNGKADIQQLTRLCEAEGWDYAKTSTGFGYVKQPNGFYAYSGAQVQHLKWMREASSSIGLKASGGIRTLADWREMAAAGATRIGTSSTLAILAELEEL